MSLYTDAAKAISNPEKTGGSLTSRIYNGKTWQNPPAKIYALVSETTKWSPILKDVIERSELLKFEKKVGPFEGLFLFITDWGAVDSSFGELARP
jgi:putative methyltransferase